MRIQVVLVFVIFGVSENQEDWLKWQPWSVCSVTCGKGFMKRMRLCSLSPENNCTGPREQRKPCRNMNCRTTTTAQQFQMATDIRPEAKVWAEWSAWTQPAVTCSNIPQVIKRTRNCANNVSENESCKGFHAESRSIILPQCCSSWSEWTPWSSPSVSCSFDFVVDTIVRAKVCTDTCSAGSCPQPTVEKKTIFAPSCERTDSWAEWSQWSPCGLVTKLLSTRVRECQSDDQTCSGQYKQAKVCGLQSHKKS